MGKEEVEQAVEKLADDDVRDAVSAGDFSALGVELTEEEQAMVAAAAADFPEVAGFAFDLGLKSGPVLKCAAQVVDRPGTTPRPKIA